MLKRTIAPKELAAFTRQLATLVGAGMPLLRTLEALSRQQRNALFGTTLDALSDAIRGGGTFSGGLARIGPPFDPLYVNMVKAGEAAGVLGVVLERLALLLEKRERIKGRVRAALTYPIVIMLVALAIVAALMVFIVPRFQGIFDGMLKGQPLPPLTLAVLGLSQFIRRHALWALLTPVVAGMVLRFSAKTEKGRQAVDALVLRLPLLGPLLLKTAVVRFTRTLGTLLAGGVPILAALTITRHTAGNRRVAGAIGQVHDRIKEGDTIAAPLRAARIFPDMMTGMVEVGEETGALPEMLARVADAYEEEVDTTVAGLTSILEPLMIVAMAVVVGIIVVALFLPIVRIVQLLS
jgi:type IV pilus assembly protein PilC